MIPDHPPDVPAHQDQSAISVGFDQERCQLCGVTSNPPHKAVADFPKPTGDGDPRGRLVCLDCYADELTDATPLSKKLARVFALQMAGYNHEQISRSEGRSVLRIEKWAKKIRDQRQDQGHGTLDRLGQYL